MKESYVEGLATHGGPESCAVAREGGGEALTGVRAGRVSSRERRLLRGADAVGGRGRPHSGRRYREAPRDPARSQTPGHVRKHLAREPGDPSFACGGWRRRPCREVQGRTPTMNGAGKSDRPIVPGKPANKDGSCRRRRGYGEPYTGTQAETPDTAKGAPTATPADSPPAAERAEERGLAKGNPRQQNAPRTPRRQYGVHSALERIRQAARRDRTLRFTALTHHVDNPAMLREAYFSLKREAAPGVDRVTWRQYGRDLEDNLLDLCGRLQRGAYRAKPVRRVFIPKSDGRQRPLGVNGAGRQDRPACDSRGAEHHLRDRLSRVQLRVPAGAQPAQCVGRALCGPADTEGELGARRGHPWVL